MKEKKIKENKTNTLKTLIDIISRYNEVVKYERFILFFT